MTNGMQKDSLNEVREGIKRTIPPYHFSNKRLGKSRWPCIARRMITSELLTS